MSLPCFDFAGVNSHVCWSDPDVCVGEGSSFGLVETLALDHCSRSNLFLPKVPLLAVDDFFLLFG